MDEGDGLERSGSTMSRFLRVTAVEARRGISSVLVPPDGYFVDSFSCIFVVVLFKTLL